MPPHLSLTLLCLVLIAPLARSDDRRPHENDSKEEEQLFYSLPQLLQSEDYGPGLEYRNLDDLFDTRDIATRLAQIKRVRIFRPEPPSDLLENGFWHFESEPALDGFLRAQPKTNLKDLPPAIFQPLLKMAADINNYSDQSACHSEIGLALLIGDNEPQWVFMCCFKCHEARIVRRPTAEHPRPQLGRAITSPEFERALFELAQKMFPADQELASFKLDPRKRAPGPPPKLIFDPTKKHSDPFSVLEPSAAK